MAAKTGGLLVRKIGFVFLLFVIGMAIWRMSGGDVGGWLHGVWNNILFPVASWVADIIISIWNAVFG